MKLSVIADALPRPILRMIAPVVDRYRLSRVEAIACDAGHMARVESNRLKDILNSPALAEEWQAVAPEMAPLAITDMAGGVNPGDRRAVYHLVRGLGVKRILEVGTHIGASTAHIAAALKRTASTDGGPVSLLSVDIMDVNDPITQPWKSFGSTYSPAELMRRLGYEGFVQFRTEPSLDYFAHSQDRFDLVFLDGNHASRQVYREVPAALRVLADGGWILLHDYFPKCRSLWPDGVIIPGPYHAIQRLVHEGANLKVLPLGALPWPTKQGTNVTSLALLGRQ